MPWYQSSCVCTWLPFSRQKSTPYARAHAPVYCIRSSVWSWTQNTNSNAVCVHGLRLTLCHCVQLCLTQPPSHPALPRTAQRARARLLNLFSFGNEGKRQKRQLCPRVTQSVLVHRHTAQCARAPDSVYWILFSLVTNGVKQNGSCVHGLLSVSASDRLALARIFILCTCITLLILFFRGVGGGMKQSWLPTFWKKIQNTQEIKRTLFN